MTATTTAGARTGATTTAKGRGGRGRRWHRIVIPLGLAALLLTTTLVTHAVDQPDPDAGFLSPVATGDHGGSRLAAALRERGVTVQRETTTAAALAAVRSAPATLFVPAPALLRRETVRALDRLPARTRLVLVDPARPVLVSAGLPLLPGERRWAAQALGPAAGGLPCQLPELGGVGSAAVGLQRYTAGSYRPEQVQFCFAGALARVSGAVEQVAVGASDPFRNDRIAEWDNLAFATGLLGVTGRVVWLDLAEPEPPPATGTGRPSRTPATEDGPGTGTGDGSGDGTGTGDGRGGPGEPGQPGGPGGGDQSGSGDGDGEAADRDDPPNPLWAAFPPWFWALLAQLALAVLFLALWRARRLGPPAAEPLPVTVRSAETVLGRARLYQRAGAREAAARTLREAALTRLLPRLNLPADAAPDRVAGAVAARTGAEPAATEELLYGGEPETDQDLLELARALDGVTRTVAPPASPDVPLPDRTEGEPR
ncbi:DUF4350 domain-containing protein [Micromonospora sp. C28SCA-DRY-2]|uniref:DUF4350 domain-containing protein n=1 Tax=Micromonospora sp. C28SCA-DRY-2 TaxID=3059522 RepID=UPI002674E518|nr:DUF4350 domain-containing protein [Micromonospora sp. C28SCA-DRY-2]MDO3701050.1 DUF4350 domain-containing protein [Micromonospora sp. C28SCA-DRY-2]